MGSGDLNITSALRNTKRIYIDSAPLIYFVERHRDYFTKMSRIIALIESAPLQAFTSVITITEIIVQPLKVGNTDLAQEYHDVLVSSNQFTLLSVTEDIAITAGAIRARYSLRTPDALHVATAIATGCDTILTNDAAMKRVTDLNVVYMDDLEP
ncbi:MAG: type II toxin-antitoxin system VapC family toxin [Chloroflexi bacterium]|nr:type II toxin-antitoxin system VapC family toxin [Chloroflexota bacterium]